MNKTPHTHTGAGTPKLQTLLLGDLSPHPDQKQSFRKHDQFERDTLKNDIEKNGVKHPPEVMPPGNKAGLPAHTIITGHTRCDILRELGHKQVSVLVRHDLKDATRLEIDKIFLLDNVARRQQDRLGQARAAQRLYMIEREQKGRKVFGDPFQNGELRDRAGNILKMSGRNLDRYLNVLRAPAEVQDAFENKRIKLIDAARVINLPEKQQKELAARLRAGEDAKAVLASYFPRGDGRHVKSVDAIASFARSLDTGHDDLVDRVEKIGPGPVLKHEQSLRRAMQLIQLLLGKLPLEEPEQSTAKVRRRNGKSH